MCVYYTATLGYKDGFLSQRKFWIKGAIINSVRKQYEIHDQTVVNNIFQNIGSSSAFHYQQISSDRFYTHAHVLHPCVRWSCETE